MVAVTSDLSPTDELELLITAHTAARHYRMTPLAVAINRLTQQPKKLGNTCAIGTRDRQTQMLSSSNVTQSPI